MSNFAKPIIAVYWSQLNPSTDRMRGITFRRDCPFCENGLLLVGRDRKTAVLEEIDGCIRCGQRVLYLDIEKMRARELPETGPKCQ